MNPFVSIFPVLGNWAFGYAAPSSSPESAQSANSAWISILVASGIL